MDEAPKLYDLRGKRVLVAGAGGMVGSALVSRLESENCEVIASTRHHVDLTDQGQVTAYFRRERPDVLFVAAARVGGILANSRYPAQFLFDNLMIAAHTTHAAYDVGVEKLLFLGSSCIYPKLSVQPIVESALLTGPLEPTNQWYAIAKIAGIKLAEAYRQQYGCNFISAMPSNLYGPNDNYTLENSHVIPALMRKAHEAKVEGSDRLEVWGTGKPRREFLYVDDCADALVHVMKTYSGAEHVNVGFGEDLSIAELVHVICKVVGFAGRIHYDTSKPDGTPQKLMCTDRLKRLGWRASTSLEDGLSRTYDAYLRQPDDGARA